MNPLFNISVYHAGDAIAKARAFCDGRYADGLETLTGYEPVDPSFRECSGSVHLPYAVDWYGPLTGRRPIDPEMDPKLLRYSAWQEQTFRAYADENVDYMSKRNPLTNKEKKQAAAFFYTAMTAYWDGSLSSRKGELEAMPGYEPFFRCAEGFAYGWWLKDLIETAVPTEPQPQPQQPQK